VKADDMAHLIPLGFRRGSEAGETRRVSRTPDFEDDDTDIQPIRLVGLESRTRVTTAFGEVPAHLLRVNDAVRTADGRFLKIRKIDVIQFEPDVLRSTVEAYPIRIGAGALRTGVPARDIYLAPEQELLASMGAHDSKVVTARTLLSRPRVMREPVDQVAYFRLDLGVKATILAEKTPVVIDAPKSAGA
jgi:hypothetical protein